MVSLLQPFIPDYRFNFFDKLNNEIPTDVFCYNSPGNIKKNNFKNSNLAFSKIKCIEKGPWLLYNPIPLLKKNKTLVLMLHFGHLTTWLLLITKFIHRKNIILWGHGISVKRFIKETNKPHFLLLWMIKLADGVWFYTENEKLLWQKEINNLKAVSLNNTISDADEILALPIKEKASLKQAYNIKQKTIFIYCARFNITERRTDLLLEVIGKMDPDKFCFIIIGDGPLKPDFSKYGNVYDYGALYDRQVKNDLFQLADIYFQPGWVGLSVVEAMAYGKPIFTFKRTETHLQCVEYSYIIPGETGMIFESVDELIKEIQSEGLEIEKMGKNARDYCAKNLTMSNMVNSAIQSISSLGK